MSRCPRVLRESNSQRPVRLLACLLAVALQGCASLVPHEKVASNFLVAPASSELADIAARSVDSAEGSAFRPIPFSDYSMDARLTLIRHASQSIDVQYYLIGNDPTGRTLLKALRDASQRGVRVRLLVDDLYTPDSAKLLAEFAEFKNVEVRVFNPFPAARESDGGRWLVALADVGRLNHRMHNKLLVVDGVFAVAGGRNMADEYFFRNREGNFIDFDLLVTGAAVSGLGRAFDLYWNSRRVFLLRDLELDDHDVATGERIFDKVTADADSAFPALHATDRDVLDYAPLSSELGTKALRLLHGNIRVVCDDPEKVSGRAESGSDATTVTSNVIEAIAGAKESVLLASPYFVPGAASMKRLRQVRDNGVAVTVVTNSMASNDEQLVSVAYSRYRVEMLRSGVQIYEISPNVIRQQHALQENFGTAVGRLHAKIVVIDRRTTFVGSMNLDFRSSRENTEIGLFVDSPELAGDVTELLDDVRAIGTYRLRLSSDSKRVEWVDTEPGSEKVYTDEPEVDWRTRLRLFILSPFVSEGLL